MRIGGYDIGVCSWSLKPASTVDLIHSLDLLKLDHTQLALVPLLEMSPEQRKVELDLLARSEIALTGGMLNFHAENYTSIGMIRKTGGLVPSEHWLARRELALLAGKLAGEIGVDCITVHLGFLPPGNDPGYPTLMQRAGEIAQHYADVGVDLLLETGQERASDLLQFLNDLNARNVGVNLDPANMILYGSGDPVEAVHTLDRHIGHVHVKDAMPSVNPGVEWGKEVPFGQGIIDHELFFRAIRAASYTGPLVIECEIEDRDSLDPIRSSIEKLTTLLE